MGVKVNQGMQRKSHLQVCEEAVNDRRTYDIHWGMQWLIADTV